MRVLILSCNTGGGHNSCGAAIQDACREQGDSCQLLDSLQFASGRLSRFMAWGHTTMYRHLPGVFRLGYGYAERHPKILNDDAAAYRLLTGGTEQLYSHITQGGYDTVICTHVFSALLLRQMLKEHPLRIKTAFVATDYTCSPGAAKSELDIYFIPSASVGEEFMACGIPDKKLVASGIPVDARFYAHQDKALAKKALGIDPALPHLLMMCGSMGCGPMKKLAELLSCRLEQSAELSIVCGTNRRLYDALENQYRNDPHIHIYGFVTDMSGLMDSADLYLTKPGGLSASEAMAKALPMVFIDAVAGCEEYNLRHFVNMGGAVTAPSVWELTELCVTLMKDPGQRAGMSAALAAQTTGNAAQCVCQVMRAWSNGVGL